MVSRKLKLQPPLVDLETVTTSWQIHRPTSFMELEQQMGIILTSAQVSFLDQINFTCSLCQQVIQRQYLKLIEFRQLLFLSLPYLGGLYAINVSDPLSPTFAGCFGGDGYVHDAQCTIYTGPDTEHQGKEVGTIRCSGVLGTKTIK